MTQGKIIVEKKRKGRKRKGFQTMTTCIGNLYLSLFSQMKRVGDTRFWRPSAKGQTIHTPKKQINKLAEKWILPCTFQINNLICSQNKGTLLTFTCLFSKTRVELELCVFRDTASQRKRKKGFEDSGVELERKKNPIYHISFRCFDGFDTSEPEL